LAPQDLCTEGVVIGVNKNRGVETVVHFGKEDRMRHMYVLGQTGTGKTVFMKRMIIQDIENSPLTGNELTQSVNNWLQENVCNVMNFTGSQCSNLDTFVDLIVTAYESQGITALELSTDTICEDLGMCAGLSV
jgi:septin family protein